MALVTRVGGVLAAFSMGQSFNPNTDLSYTGTMSIIDDGGGNWRMKLLTSGTLTFTALMDRNIDLFLVGGGGAGGATEGGGGGGGYTRTELNKTFTLNTPYSVVIGAGGAAPPVGDQKGGDGGTTSAFGYTAAGGIGGNAYGSANRNGGAGGSGGGAGKAGVGGIGGSNGSNGSNAGGSYGGAGQGSTTREFAEATGDLYAGGGGGCQAAGGDSTAGGGNTSSNGATAGVVNTGGGGGGTRYNIATNGGGSGVVVIRNHRAA